MNIQKRVSHQCIDGEVVIINLETGSYYSLQKTAAALWERVAAGLSREEAVASMADAYPQNDVLSDGQQFIDQLIAEGLIREETAPQRGPVSLEWPIPYTAPVIEKFTDMQELLMLDPIHEVDDAGWPRQPIKL